MMMKFRSKPRQYGIEAAAFKELL